MFRIELAPVRHRLILALGLAAMACGCGGKPDSATLADRLDPEVAAQQNQAMRDFYQPKALGAARR